MLISQLEFDSKKSRDKIPLECYQCKKTHYRCKNLIQRILNGNLKNTNKGCFCSKECWMKHKSKMLIHKCQQCEKEVKRTPSGLNGKNIFCSHSCSAIYNNKNKIINKYSNDNTSKLISVENKIIRIKSCIFCNKDFTIKSNKNQKYCSSGCRSAEHRKMVYDKISNGEVNGHASKTMRQYLISVRGCKCETCGISEWMGYPLVVIMDHINGNSDDNSLTNLRLICSNCDTLTPTYKCKNKGKGRAYRRQRYSEGRSY
jgi:hypothetical protein